MKRHRLLDGLTHLSVQGISTPETQLRPKLPTIDSDNEFAALLHEFPEVTQAYVSECPVQHNLTHHIQTTGPPINAHTCRLPPERFKAARQEFQHKLHLGIIRPSSSSWSSLLHMVPKKASGDWRPCDDSTTRPSWITIRSHTSYIYPRLNVLLEN